jgi:hypothetical protein
MINNALDIFFVLTTYEKCPGWPYLGQPITALDTGGTVRVLIRRTRGSNESPPALVTTNEKRKPSKKMISPDQKAINKVRVT